MKKRKTPPDALPLQPLKRATVVLPHSHDDHNHLASVAIIIPVHNAEAYLDETLASLVSQTYPHRHLTVHICDDASTDSTPALLQKWCSLFAAANIRCVLSTTHGIPPTDNTALISHRHHHDIVHSVDGKDIQAFTSSSSVAVDLVESVGPVGPVDRGGNRNTNASPSSSSAVDPDGDQNTITASSSSSSSMTVGPGGSINIKAPTSSSSMAVSSHHHATGAGNAKNTAVGTSTSPWLCFIDADDIMFPTRIEEQHRLAMSYPLDQQQRLLIGSGFVRLPTGSTDHYTKWCNSLTKAQLTLQQFREVTVIQPTWFLSRQAFDAVGGYRVQSTQGTKTPIPSDLIFFQQHLDRNGLLDRVPKPLVTYRYLSDSVSWKIPRKTLLRVRLRALERRVLEQWDHFTIWGAGRDGKSVVNELGKLNCLSCLSCLSCVPCLHCLVPCICLLI
jgi:glycosyltransferase involved in cell wall biosynthesis